MNTKKSRATHLTGVNIYPLTSDRTPDVYTQFRKRVESQAPVRKCLDMPKAFKPLPEGVEEGEVPTNRDLGVEGNPITAV